MRIMTATLGPSPPMIRPLQGAAVGVDSDPNLAELLQNPIKLNAGEEIAVQAVHTSGAAQDIRAVLWLTRRLERAPAGNIITLRGESSTAATAGAWTTITVNWDYQLPSGVWGVCGSECISPTGMVHRYMFVGMSWRPGGLSQNNLLGNRTHRYFMSGTLGIWGGFSSPVMPRVQVYCTSADASHTVFMQVMKLS